MNDSRRGPARGDGRPFVMHLEKVCRLIEMGQRFTVEFNPNSDAAAGGMEVIRDVRLSILKGGEVCMQAPSGAGFALFDLTLATYKRVWRCWQNGLPGVVQRRETRWG